MAGERITNLLAAVTYLLPRAHRYLSDAESLAECQKLLADEAVKIARLHMRIIMFDEECARAGHTDTGAAWELLHEARDLLESLFRDTTKKESAVNG